METVENRIRVLVSTLNAASKKYHSSGTPILSDKEYDEMFRELASLEKETGLYLEDSPTAKVGHGGIDTPVKHFAPVLSLHDTKSIDDLTAFLGEHAGILSWKLDGVSIVLHYENGRLTQALSRGDGHYGKDITRNVMIMRGVPLSIDHKGLLILRGEGCLRLSAFEQIKQTKEGERYSNPRNTVSGLVNAKRTSSALLRQCDFIAHSVVKDESSDIHTRHAQLGYLKHLGFHVVPHRRLFNFDVLRTIEEYQDKLSEFDYPVDGLVLTIDEVRYGDSLGATARYPKHSMAYKWADVVVHSPVTGMDWSVSKTGLITPVVMFEPVVIEGTIVERANLHSLKIFEELQIGLGDTLRIYKANKIIPEVEDNLTRSNTETYPTRCPFCGCATTVIRTPQSKKLYCVNCSKT